MSARTLPKEGQHSDQDLVARVRCGDQRAFEQLYHRYEPSVSKRALRVLGRTGEAEDVVQATFVECFRSLDRYQPSRPFGPWLNGIAYRVTANHLRSKKRRRWLRTGLDIVMNTAVDPTAPASDEQAAHKQLLNLLNSALETLSVDHRMVFTLHEIEGLSYTDIGRIIGKSPQTVRARALSARKRVLQRIGDVTGDSSVEVRDGRVNEG